MLSPDCRQTITASDEECQPIVEYFHERDVGSPCWARMTNVCTPCFSLVILLLLLLQLPPILPRLVLAHTLFSRSLYSPQLSPSPSHPPLPREPGKKYWCMCIATYSKEVVQSVQALPLLSTFVRPFINTITPSLSVLSLSLSFFFPSHQSPDPTFLLMGTSAVQLCNLCRDTS